MADAVEPLQKGHTRSVSASGIVPIAATSRPSALKRGHQRAFSHGQTPLEEETKFVKGHNRISSKTDFILPPGHRDSETKKGHSRQASRSESIYTLRQNAPPTKLQQILSFVFRKKIKTDPDVRTRTIVPNHIVPPRTPLSSHPNGATPNNKIRTSKYTLLTFLPKNLLEQFHRIANLYFLFIVILNWVPSINAFGKEVAMIPVLFVLGVTGVKDLFEDRRRLASDKRINSSTCRVYDSELERYKKTVWQDLRVGDLVHLSNNEIVPADVLLLRSSDEHGSCYLDTCNLDGESNLKLRNVPQGYVEKQNAFTPNQFRSILEVDSPTTKLYHFHGAIVDPNGARTSLSTNHLLLRDSVIKNTDFVEGIVVYCGHETKAMMNSSASRYKRSSLEKQMNVDVMWCVVILLLLCLIGAVRSKMWLSSFANHLLVPFIITSWSSSYEAWLTFWTFIIILQVMIPLSLYVSVEVTKMLQVYHINNDVDLYDSETNKRFECRALNITEQLGQIQYIFSDKTGTLTENKMLFRRCTIAGIDYNHSSGKVPKDAPPHMQLTPNAALLADLNNSSSQSQNIKDFLLALALCNTVVVAAHPHHDIMNSSGVIENVFQPTARAGDESRSLDSQYNRRIESRSVTPSPTPLNQLPFHEGCIIPSEERRVKSPGVKVIPTLSPISSSAENSPTPQLKQSASRPKLLNVPSMPFFSRKQSSKNGLSPKSTMTKPIFEAESPDELALVQMAFTYNCRLVKRTSSKVLLSLPGEQIAEYEVLRILPFDSGRKCMTVVVRAPVTNKIIAFCKGADSSIFPKLKETRIEESTLNHVGLYASQGLRVLVIASRVVPESAWNEMKIAIENAEMTCNPLKIRQAYSAVECCLNLLGVTGIEDRLQSGVGETLGVLRSAGIVVWVLTGDKTETATNVAVACGLFTPQMEILRVVARSKNSAESAIQFYTDEVISQNSSGHSSNSVINGSQRALIVDGNTLTFILDQRSNLTLPFLELTKYCSAVLCARVTPLQKAFIVKVVKEKLRMRTLAIGDGANDVSMIKAADVGIGIAGEEGMQAVMASDFAMAKFRFLQKLLLVHGHWAYYRLANMVLYFFYKNATFVFLIFWFQLYCGYSGTVMIDQMYHMLYNLFFTALPPLAIGVYDKDAPEAVLLARPYLYRIGRLGLAYRNYSFWITVADALYQSTAIFFITVCAYWGTEIGLWEFGTTITSSCMFAMLFQVAFETRSWTLIHAASLLISLGTFYAFCLVYNNICMQCWGLPSNTWVLSSTLLDPSYWLIVLLSTVLALLPRFAVRSLEGILKPNDIVKAILDEKKVMEAGGNFLMSWSRSTSTSSIYRVNDPGAKAKTTGSLTAVG